MKINDKYLIKNVKNESRELEKALRSLQLSGTSKIINEYEKKLAVFFKSKYALALSSGTAALHVALYILGVKENDEVLIPAISPLPTVLPLITVRARPVIVDIEKNRLGFNIDDLRRKVTSNTKATILVPVWGYPIDYSKTIDVLKKHNIPLIEDAAQAHGAKIGSKYMGTIGTLGCFSTHDRKILSTGEGGFILTNNEELHQKMKQFSQLGYMDGKTYGVNYKISGLQAALGIHRLKQINGQIKKRTENVELLMELIKETGLKEFPVVNSGTANYYSLVLLLPWDKTKNLKFIRILDSYNIPSDIIKYKFRAIYHRPLFKRYKTNCPNTERLISHMTTIPVHPGLTRKEIFYMAEKVTDSLKKVNRDN